MAKNSKKDPLERVLEKLDKLDDRLDSVDKTLVKQEENLKEHIRRTELLEEELKPIKKHIGHMEGALKLFGGIGLLLGIVTGILKILGLL